jgi:hypothetical protein
LEVNKEKLIDTLIILINTGKIRAINDIFKKALLVMGRGDGLWIKGGSWPPHFCKTTIIYRLRMRRGFSVWIPYASGIRQTGFLARVASGLSLQ